MTERIPQMEKEEKQPTLELPNESTPKEWREKLRGLIEGARLDDSKELVT